MNTFILFTMIRRTHIKTCLRHVIYTPQIYIEVDSQLNGATKTYQWGGWKVYNWADLKMYKFRKFFV
jgi:hypothetical protein